jgi:hypothetical protein
VLEHGAVVRFARWLQRDHVVLEATDSAAVIAGLLAPHAGGWQPRAMSEAGRGRLTRASVLDVGRQTL